MFKQMEQGVGQFVCEKLRMMSVILEGQDHLLRDASGGFRLSGTGVEGQGHMGFSADGRPRNVRKVTVTVAEFHRLTAPRAGHLPFVEIFCTAVEAEARPVAAFLSAERTGRRKKKIQSAFDQTLCASSRSVVI
jgi:hypothetical protein